MEKRPTFRFLLLILVSSGSVRNAAGSCFYSFRPSEPPVPCEDGGIDPEIRIDELDLIDACPAFTDRNFTGRVEIRKILISGCSDLSESAFFERIKTSRLEELSLTKIGKFPAFDGSFDRLRVLNLSNNELRDVSDLSAVFGSAGKLEKLDLSGNAFETFDAAFPFQFPSLKSFTLKRCVYLREILFSDDGTLSSLTTLDLGDNSALRRICPAFISSAPGLRRLNLSGASLETLPLLSSGNSSIEILDLTGTFVRCDCRLPSLKILTRFPEFYDELKCRLENDKLIKVSEVDGSLKCSSAELVPINIPEDSSVSRVWDRVILDCDVKGGEVVTWITPKSKVIQSAVGESCAFPTFNACPGDIRDKFDYDSDNLRVFPNGSLAIIHVGWKDRGFYECVTQNGRANYSVSAKLELHSGYRTDLYHYSLIYGFATAGGFLSLTLIVKLVHFLLHNYGCCLCCCCCKDRLPPKAKKLKTAIDSIEVYRTQQLDKLKENYNLQNEWIRQNCTQQMERVRDNYNSQVQNLKDIKQYGTSQLSSVRLQYFDQMQRIRDYSTSQLNRLHENYIFQRQRLRKFNDQNYVKICETRKYTQKTLNKVMDTLPNLYLDLTACRQGIGERHDSVILDPNSIQILELGRIRGRIETGEVDSLYFTPSGTPIRDSGRPSTELGNYKSTPVRDRNPYRDVYVASGNPKRSRIKSKSFSNFLPLWKTSNNEKEETVVVIENANRENDYISVANVEEEVKVESEKVV